MQQKSQLIIKEQGTEICKEKTEDKNIWNTDVIKKQNEKRDRKNVLKKLERMGEHFCITAVRKKKKEEKWTKIARKSKKEMTRRKMDQKSTIKEGWCGGAGTSPSSHIQSAVYAV